VQVIHYTDSNFQLKKKIMPLPQRNGK